MWLNRFGSIGSSSGRTMYYVEFNPDDPGGASMKESSIGIVGSLYAGAAANDGLYIGQDSYSLGFIAENPLNSSFGEIRFSSTTLQTDSSLFWNGGNYPGIGIVFEAPGQTRVYFYNNGSIVYDCILEDYFAGPYTLAASLDQTSALALRNTLLLTVSSWIIGPTELPAGRNSRVFNNLTSFLDQNSGTVTSSVTINKGSVPYHTPFVTNTTITQIEEEPPGWGFASTNAIINTENNRLATLITSGGLTGTVGGNNLSKIKSNTKIYLELNIDNFGNHAIGQGFHNALSSTLNSSWIRFWVTAGRIYLGINSNTTAYNIDSLAGGNFVSCWAIDTVSGKVWIRSNNNAWYGGGDPTLGTSPTFTANITGWAPYGEGYIISGGPLPNADARIAYDTDLSFAPAILNYSPPTGFTNFT